MTKKILILTAMVLMIAGNVLAIDQGKDIEVKTLSWYGPTGAAATGVGTSATATSQSIDLTDVDGYFGLQLYITGTGTADVYYTISNDGNTFRRPEGEGLILNDIIKTSGGNSDGRVYDTVRPACGRYMKIEILEVGAVGSVTPTGYLAVQ